MASAPKKMTRRQKVVAFTPALVVLGITALTASGMSVVPGATAANTVTASGTVTKTMSVPLDTADGNCAAQSVGDFTDGAFRTSVGTCMVTFATNSTAGAAVTIRDNDSTAPFFCTAACTDASNNSLGGPSALGPEALGNDQFGVAVQAVGGSPTPTAGSEFAVDPDGVPTAAELIWGPVGTTDLTICATSSETTANNTCTLRFAVDGQGSTQTAGTYNGTVYLNATPL